ncbi:aspartate aminotransferase, putative [Plasmodium chabaudi adami]|uniref:Aspartate aminotransferase n=1 Tax=Plasmodium chabaudi adami TaxID=5826 RepID=A0A1C6X9N3_PLACE|nr:aspartate aminotransferase, putative [Plasmodium chabaudi adami]
MERYLSEIKEIEADEILKSIGEYNADPSDKKVNLSIGVCAGNNGKVQIFNTVLKAEQIIKEKYEEKPYLLSNGGDRFSLLTQKIIFGEDSEYIKEKRISTIQTIGGTGAIAIALEFLKCFNMSNPSIYVTNIPYINHVNMIKSNGFNLKYINFFDYNLIDINYNLFLNDLKNIDNESVIFLQPSCYNPCSININSEYFEEITNIVLLKKHIIVFDIAYQGFGNGEMDNDVTLIRQFQKNNIPFIVCQSFAKNMSLYGERAGALHIVCKNENEKKKILSSLLIITRRFYSSPTIHTNRLVCEILENPNLKIEWLNELKQLAHHIANIRNLFFDKLQQIQNKYNLNYDWSVYKKQVGLFSYVPIFSDIFQSLKNHHIYIVKTGRINVSGITMDNIDYITETICLCLSERAAS